MSVVYTRAGDLPPLPSADYAPAVATSENLYDMAHIILDRLRNCALNAGINLPKRQTVYLSPIPADCEQVAVLFDGWDADHTWDVSTHCNAFRWAGRFSVVITRCTPALPGRKGEPPTIEQMDAAAKLGSKDADLMTCLVSSMDEIGSLSIAVQAPQGGFQTVAMDLTLPAFGALE